MGGGPGIPPTSLRNLSPLRSQTLSCTTGSHVTLGKAIKRPVDLAKDSVWGQGVAYRDITLPEEELFLNSLCSSRKFAIQRQKKMVYGKFVAIVIKKKLLKDGDLGLICTLIHTHSTWYCSSRPALNISGIYPFF